jgi:hypothetical protein
MDLITSIIGNSDGFPVNNFYVYQSPVTNRWAPIAHDFDLSMRSPPSSYHYEGDSACSLYKSLFDQILPIFTVQLPERVKELAQIVNSSISHPLGLNAYTNFQTKLKNLLNKSREIVCLP